MNWTSTKYIGYPQARSITRYKKPSNTFGSVSLSRITSPGWCLFAMAARFSPSGVKNQIHSKASLSSHQDDLKEVKAGIKLEWESGPLSQDSSKERSFNYHLYPRDYDQWDSAYLQFFVNQRTKKLAMCAIFAVRINPDSIRLCPQPCWIEEITGDSSAGNCYQKPMLKVKTSQKFNVQEEEVDSAGWASGDVIGKMEVYHPGFAGSGRPCMLGSKKSIVQDILAKFP